MKYAKSEFQELSPHYVHRMRSMPILTIDEEYKLAKKWRDEGDQVAVSKLVESHLKFITKIAAGYRGYGLPLSDLISEGNVGMMQAVRHFDPDRGFRLSTYAMWWIKAAIQEYILRTWSLVRIGTTAGQKRLFFGLRKQKKLIKSDDHRLTPEIVAEIATKLGVREDEVWDMDCRLSFPDHSLNVAIKSSGEGQSEWVEWLVDERDNQEVVTMDNDEAFKRKQLFDQAMEHLSERERRVIIERRLKEPGETLEAVGEKLGISRERVRQIEVKAFDKLQKAIKRLSRSGYHQP